MNCITNIKILYDVILNNDREHLPTFSAKELELDQQWAENEIKGVYQRMPNIKTVLTKMEQNTDKNHHAQHKLHIEKKLKENLQKRL